MLRIVVIASGQDYQEAAAWAAPTYVRNTEDSSHVSVLIPEQENASDLLAKHSKRFGFVIGRFPLATKWGSRITSSLKCQAFLFATGQLKADELLFLVDADTYCVKCLRVTPAVEAEILNGKIGLVPDVIDWHSNDPEHPWYLAPQMRLPYVNSGVILASHAALDMFQSFAELSGHPQIDVGPFHDQKVVNFALGKFFRDRLCLLDRAYNTIGPRCLETTIIGHCAGGAGEFSLNGRKVFHQAVCARFLKVRPDPVEHLPAANLGAAVNRNARASILLLNWKRPENVKQILDRQSGYESVGEILIFNNNRHFDLKYSDPKVRILNASCDFGLRTRWVLGALAANDCLVFQDDDIVLPEFVIQQFIHEINTDRERAYSLHGRNPELDGVYNYRAAHGEAEIVLTRATAVHRAVIPLIFLSESAFRNSGFELPVSNGEDIFLSYCLSGHFGKKHKILDLPYEDLPTPDAISARPDHTRQRTAVVRACKQCFLAVSMTAEPELSVDHSGLQRLADAISSATPRGLNIHSTTSRVL